MDDIIKKAAQVSGSALKDGQLEKINTLTLRPLTSDEVFVFKVVMCDNEVDRSSEVFPLDTLHELAPLYIGKTVISDHSRSADRQVARIFDTEVVQSDGTTKTGEAYNQLVAYCYMLRTDTNKDLIAEIEAGIKKEVSVGCAIRSAVCSICGADNRKHWCDHMPGKEYEGKTCYFKLEGARDAYELSFVAVPCQPAAGTTKNYGADKPQDTKPDAGRPQADAVKLYEAYIFTEKERNDVHEQENA